MSRPAEKQTCEDLIDSAMASTMHDLRRMLDARNGEPHHQEGEPEYEECYDDPDAFHGYGLEFTYQPYDAESDRPAHFRYLMSWGGPSDELRFYVTPGRFGGMDCHKAEYVYRVHDPRRMDWWDGASRRCYGDDMETALDVLECFDQGNLDEMIEEAMS